MSLGEPKQIEVAGQRSFACFDGVLRLETVDAELSATGTLTLVLAKDADRWLIDTLAWGAPRPA